MKILVGYDGSKVSADAIKLAIRHAKAFNGKVYIVTSMEGGPQVPREDFERSEKDLDYVKSIVKKDEIPCETHLSVRGMPPGEDLVKYAKENQIDQIVMGIRRRSKVGKLVFGSTAQYVILESPCPVLTVK